MKFAYLVCLAALIQVSTCQPLTEITTASASSVNIHVETDPIENVTISTEAAAATDSTTTTLAATTVQQNTTETAEETESIPYVTEPESSSVQEDSSPSAATTTEMSGSYASLVHPTFLVAVLVPVCSRLFSTKLAGVV